MHEQPPVPPLHETTNKDAGERAPKLSPRIYVVSLADYVAGRLHGVWLDAARDPAAIHGDIARMLAASPEPGAEEFAIHDFDELGAWRVDEYDSVELVARVAQGIVEHGPAFAAWAYLHEDEPERFEHFAQAYLGSYSSVADYAEQLADDLGWQDAIAELPPSLVPYVQVDYAAMARDLEAEGSIESHRNCEGGVWLFDSRE